MNIKNKTLSVSFKIIIVLSALYGVYLNSGLPEKFSPQMFLYYTILSNILCLGYFIYASIITIINDEHKLNMSLKGSVTMAITVTMIIYWFILVPAGFVMGDGKQLANLLVHLFVPLLVLLDYLLFDPKGKLQKKDPLFWLSIPLAYYIFTFIAYFFDVRYMSDTRFPYFFIDHTIIGIPNVILSVCGLIIFFVVLGYLIYFIDYLLSKKQ